MHRSARSGIVRPFTQITIVLRVSEPFAVLRRSYHYPVIQIGLFKLFSRSLFLTTAKIFWCLCWNRTSEPHHYGKDNAAADRRELVRRSALLLR
jgi:hypothetical protein